jgi:hypothetical protein
MVFAHIFHHSIPGLAHPIANKVRAERNCDVIKQHLMFFFTYLSTKPQKALVPVFRATVVCCTVLYIWIAVVLASAFGQDMEQSSNLMWKHHHAVSAVDDQPGGASTSSSWLYKAISWYVVCFPALDVVSAFPLNAITLGNNLLGALYGRRTHEFEVRDTASSSCVLLPPLRFD